MSNNPKLATEKQVQDVSNTFAELFNHQGKQIKALESGVIDAIEPSSPAPTKRGEYKVTKVGVYINFKDGNGQPISVTQEDYSSGNVSIIFNGTNSRMLIVPITFDGKIEKGDTRGISGNEVYLKTVNKEYYNKSQQSSKFNSQEKELNINLIEGYYNANVTGYGDFITGSGRLTKEFIYESGEVYVSSTFRGSSTALAFYFDINNKIIGHEYKGVTLDTSVINYKLIIPSGTVKIAVQGFENKTLNAECFSLDIEDIKIYNELEEIYNQTGNIIDYFDINGNKGYSCSSVGGVVTLNANANSRIKIVDIRGNNIGESMFWERTSPAPSSRVLVINKYGGVVNSFSELKGDYIKDTNNASFIIIPTLFNGFFKVRGSKHIDELISISRLGKFMSYANSNTLRIALKYNFKNDLNIGNKSILNLVRIENEQGLFLNSNVRTGKTTEYLAVEKDNIPSMEKTSYPFPYFNSGYGWETNTSVEEIFKKHNLPSRNLKYKKPICGDTAFSIWYKGEYLINTPYNDLSRNVEDLEYQNHLMSNLFTITITDNSFIINKNGVIYQEYKFSIYKTLRNLYDKLKEDSKIGNVLYGFELNFNSVGVATGVDGEEIPSNVLVKCDNVRLVSKYPRDNGQSTTNMKWDSFPFYIPFAIDNSIHTLEIIMDVTRGIAIVKFDGENEFYNSLDAMPFIGSPKIGMANKILNGVASIHINTIDLNVLESIITTNIDDVSVNMDKYIIASDLHPFIVGQGGHGLFHGPEIPYKAVPTGYDDELVTEDNPYPIIPVKYKDSVPGYRGDDVVPIPVSHSSGNLEKFLRLMHLNNYIPVSLDDVKEFLHHKKKLPPKCYFIQFDDARTYIYEDKDLRTLFNRYGVKPSFTCAESNFVDYEPWVSKYNGTVEHRRKLIKRLSYMQKDGYMCTMHGEDENVYMGMSSKEMYRVVEASIEMAKYLEISSNHYTWAASRHTLNAIMTHKHSGIEMTLRSSGDFVSISDPINCVSRGYFDSARYLTSIGWFRF
ncbi:hypothetical protein [Myroides sp.]|uniref:hypothetical protein n=1 Tax=Myroides sp. TaxID=1874736 RepID=UPI003F2F35F6